VQACTLRGRGRTSDVLDCYAACQRGECKPSKVNSITNALNSITNQMAITNSKIVWSTAITGATRMRL
jgi:prophage tail gpP-like protein